MSKFLEIMETSAFFIFFMISWCSINFVLENFDVLLKILAKSILDPHRHNLSIIDWGCSKHGDKLSLDSSDFEPYLNMSLSDILEKIK